MLAKEGVLAGAEAALAQTTGDVGSRESHTVGRRGLEAAGTIRCTKAQVEEW
jgi:hypothetical protein